MKTGKTLQKLAVELKRQNDAKKDYLVDTSLLNMCLRTDDPALEIFDNVDGKWGKAFGVTEITHGQIGRHFGIPAGYYEKLRGEFPELLLMNVNRWFKKTPSVRMLRTLDGVARAFLSCRYRRLDNYEVAETVLPIIGRMPGASIESCELTERKMYIKVIDPRVTAEVVPGDVVQAGVIITNSEVGLGSVNVSPLIYRLACSNGMIAQDMGMKKYHIGRLNESSTDSYEIYRDETIKADDKAFLMKLEDTVRAAVDEAQFVRLVGRLRDSTEAKIDAASAPKVVELTAKEYSITQDESNSILGHLIEGGDLSLYGLANAVTRHAKDVDDYDRSTELEGVGFKIVTIAPALWRRLNAGIPL